MTTTPKALPDLIVRLSDEADLCRNEGADDIARLLDEAVQALNALKPADHLASAGGVEIDRLRDALSHIQKACVLSRTQSRRIRWIETRAHGALIGDDRLHRSIDLPKDGGPDTAEKLRRRMLQDRHTFRVAQGLAAGILSAALSKEREVADGLAEVLGKLCGAIDYEAAVNCSMPLNFQKRAYAADQRFKVVDEAKAALTAHRESRGDQ